MKSHYRSFLTIAALAAISISSLVAAPRPWKSADGLHSTDGEFLKRDASGVTIRNSNFKEINIPTDQLHADDRAWLNQNHPLSKLKAAPANAIFDQLEFGDSRAEVEKKLKTSKFLELTVDETFIGRTGINGVFRTRKKIGGLDVTLFFDWTEQGTLKELTLQTASLPASSLNEKLKPCWQEFTQLLTILHGRPLHANPSLSLESIADGTLAPTHLWKLDSSGSAMLGAAREGSLYQIAVRFTQKTIQPAFVSP